MAWNDRNKGDLFSEEMLENESDRQMEMVANKVSTLKHIAIDLRTEAKDQVSLLDNASGLFESASGLLSNSFKRVQGMRRTRVLNCKYMCYFALIAVTFLLVMYLLLGRVMR